MESLDGMRFRTAAGGAFDASAVRVVRHLKGDRRMPKWVYLAECGARQLLLKVRSIEGLKARWRAVRGRSSLQLEAQNLARAEVAGFAVPQLVAVGTGGRVGLPDREALLVVWLKNHVCLRDKLELAAAEKDASAMAAVRNISIELLARARRAGLSDKDFGFHNLLMPSESGGEPVWTDVERLFVADSADPEGTWSGAGSLLSSWWLSAGPDQQALEQTLSLVVGSLPEPRGGWRAIEKPLNRYIEGKIEWHLAHARTPAPPAHLSVS